MKDVLIINATRMGDLIQTTPVIVGLKKRYPEIRITLLASAEFAEICKYIPFIDRLFVINVRDILTKLDHVMLIECFHDLDDLLHQVNDTCYDVVINFTHSPASAVLTSLIDAKEVRGLTIDEEGHSIKKHPWIKYFFDVIPGRDYNPFHLCDMYIKAAGATPETRGLHLYVPKEMEDWADALLMENEVKRDDLVIGLQLGASAEDKRWHVRSFARLADKLTDSFGAKILLTGSGQEMDYGREFESVARTMPLNFIGKTDLKELTALLKRCNLFVGNDSGPLHIATAVGTKTVNISLASVYFRETGPYDSGHYVIKTDIPCSPCSFSTDCKNMVCKEVINADNVFELTRMVLSEKDLSRIEDSPLWKDVQVYRSYFDEDGLIEYQPIIKRPLTKEILFTHIYRQTWLRILDDEETRNIEDIYQSLVERLNNWYDTSSINLSALIEDEFKAFMRLNSLAEMGLSRVKLIAKEAKRQNPDVGWIKETWKEVPLIDHEIETIGHIHSPLHPLTTFFRYGKEGLEGRDLALLSEGTCDLYLELKRHVSNIIDLLGYIRSGGLSLEVHRGFYKELRDLTRLAVKKERGEYGDR